MKKTAGNKVLPKAGLNGFDWTFVQNSTFVLRFPPHRQAVDVMCYYEMRAILIIISVLFFSCATKNEKQIETTKDSISVPDETQNIDNEVINYEDVKKVVYDSVTTFNCELNNLSKYFNIKVLLDRYTSKDSQHDSCTVKLLILDKASNKINDSIKLYSNLYYTAHFVDCENVMSYSTKFNIKKQIVDNNYGDIIVADLNFDNRDDIVVVNDMGGNGGAFYSFYVQNSDKNFMLDNYLTDSITYFYLKIDSIKKTLTTYVHAGACGLGEHIHTFDDTSKQWREKSHRIIDICKE